MLSIRRFLLRDILSLMAVVVLGLGGLAWFAGWQILRHQATGRLEEALTRLSHDIQERESLALRCAGSLQPQGLGLGPRPKGHPSLPPGHAFASLLVAHPEIHRFRFLEPQGASWTWERPSGQDPAALFASQGQPQATRAVDLALAEQAAGQRRPFWSHGQPGRRDSAVWGTLVRPLHSDGSFVGAILVEMSAAELERTFAESNNQHALMVLLLSGDGLALLPSTKTPVGDDLLQQVRLHLQEASAPVVVRAGGAKHLLYHRTFEDRNWRLAVALPLRTFDHEYRKYRYLLLAYVGFCVLLLVWRTQKLARRFRTPLRQLAEVTRAMEAGEIPPPVETEIREVRRLSEAITRAAEGLQRQLSFERNAVSAQRLELMGSLAGGIAHDVNNHLTAILGQMGLAREGLPKDHPSFPRLERAEDAALRCTDMLRALLNFSGRTPSEMESLDLNLVVTRSAELFERLLGGLITLDLRLHPALPRIRGSRVNLEQVLMNLAVNARDAMPEGGTLSIETFFPSPDEVQIRVSDTGRGIPAADLPHIFEPFFTTKAPDKGSGLGLAMVRSILQEQGARIEVETQEGVGTTFLLSFPACHEAPRHFPRPNEPAQATPNLEGRRILVVEDEPNLRELLSETFLKCRAMVASAPNGAIAWHMLQESRFDLVFTDQRMPELTGLQLIERIRRDVPGLPVVLASGFHLEGPELERIGRDPHLRFLAKPFMLPAALNLVASMLRTADLGRIDGPEAEGSR